MKLLLDTHALLWWWTNHPSLSKSAREAIADESNTVLVSSACAWEITTKHRLGKLPQAGAALSQFNDLVMADGFVHLPINYLHALRAGSYDVVHRDPFDRMLAAQSELEDAVVVSVDPAIQNLGARVLW